MLTNDGDLAQRLTHPSFGVEKEYLVEIDGVPAAGDLRRLRLGIDLDDGKTAPATVGVVAPGVIRMVIHEGPQPSDTAHVRCGGPPRPPPGAHPDRPALGPAPEAGLVASARSRRGTRPGPFGQVPGHDPPTRQVSEHADRPWPAPEPAGGAHRA